MHIFQYQCATFVEMGSKLGVVAALGLLDENRSFDLSSPSTE